MARLIKYLLNASGLLLMIWMSYLSYALLVRFPPCNQVMAAIWSNVRELVLIYTVYLAVGLLLNWFVQRKLEHRPHSREHLALALLQAMLLVIAVYYFSYDFYSHCGMKS